ncbi:hypothetical protein KC902_03985 [Candidatus Kaiserbacteria bacterium]|nr:hypothetical protein [Candidatus Kaiserbacteria bacterium]USN88745.1 MAG: hypothetical protein H6780_04635 [Candidatus Nomurabacteria bacterium]
MRVLFISGELIGSAVVHQLIKEGHEVKLFVAHKDRHDCLRGFAVRTDNWHDELPWVGKDGLIVFDDVTFGDTPDNLRAEGYSVFGGSKASSDIELDRELFQRIMADAGIATLPSFDFDTPDEAMTFVKENPGEWVIKQNSHISALNYVGLRQDGQDILDMLQYYKDMGIAPLHLQKKATGIEIGVARYFNGTDWVGPIEINMEHKPLMNESIGPLTAEMGTLMWYETDESQPIFQATLAKLKPYLTEIGYKGDIDVGCIVNEDGVWPLETTTRFGTPSTELQCELQISPWGDMLKSIADGEAYNLQYHDEYGIVVSVTVPPFPFAPDNASGAGILTSKGMSVFFADDFTDEDMQHVHFEEVSKTTLSDGSTRHFLGGHHGYALYVTGKGKTVEEARTKAYDIVRKIFIPKMMYRTDIGSAFLTHEQTTLREWGWIA